MTDALTEKTRPGALERDQSRVGRALAIEADRRMRQSALARSAAMAALAPVAALISGWPELLYYLGVLALFAALGWAQFALLRARVGRSWTPFLFVTLDFALTTFVLLWQSPLREFPLPPQLMLRGAGISYFFLLLAGLAFSFRPWLVLWGGLSGAACWSLGWAAIIALPDTVTSLTLAKPTTRAEMDAAMAVILRPEFVDLGSWLQQVAVLLLTAALLALVVQGSRRLVHRQAALERRSANLARYFPSGLAESMAERDNPFGQERERRAAVLFTDIVGFTGWAEGRSSAAVVAFLRDAHALVARAVFDAGGVLDKFIGDGVMATFGVAQAHDDRDRDAGRHARDALDCVEAILVAFAALNAARAARGEVAMRISIGVHFGPVVVGDVGSDRRMELAVLGDTVNVASRLESLTRPLHCAAVVSQEVMDAAGGPPPAYRLIGARPIAGRRGAEVVWARDAPPAAEGAGAAG